MKVFIGVGHGGNDPGAVGLVVEKDVNLSMALACKNFLEKNGVQVEISRMKDENDPINGVVRKCNDFGPNLAVDVHNNAGGGKGFEAYFHYKGGTGQTLAKNIESEVLKIGQNSRGTKTKLGPDGRDYFAFIRGTVAPAVIVEGFFVDNATDVAIANTAEKQKVFGEAFARGILATLGIAAKETAVSKGTAEGSGETAKYFVQIGAYSVKENAEAALLAAKKAGFNDAFIK